MLWPTWCVCMSCDPIRHSVWHYQFLRCPGWQIEICVAKAERVVWILCRYWWKRLFCKKKYQTKGDNSLWYMEHKVIWTRALCSKQLTVGHGYNSEWKFQDASDMRRDCFVLAAAWRDQQYWNSSTMIIERATSAMMIHNQNQQGLDPAAMLWWFFRSNLLVWVSWQFWLIRGVADSPPCHPSISPFLSC